jgi:hypothetical protein
LAFELHAVYIDAMVKDGVLPAQSRSDPDAIIEAIWRVLQLALF